MSLVPQGRLALADAQARDATERALNRTFGLFLTGFFVSFIFWRKKCSVLGEKSHSLTWQGQARGAVGHQPLGLFLVLQARLLKTAAFEKDVKFLFWPFPRAKGKCGPSSAGLGGGEQGRPCGVSGWDPSEPRHGREASLGLAGCWDTYRDESWGTLQRQGRNPFWGLSPRCSSPAEHRNRGFRGKRAMVSK